MEIDGNREAGYEEACCLDWYAGNGDKDCNTGGKDATQRLQLTREKVDGKNVLTFPKKNSITVLLWC